jgi:hypothetical protein
MQAAIVEFVRSVLSYWGSLLTGGILIASIWIWEHYRGEAVPWRLVALIAGLALATSTFMAWREQHQALLEERAYRSRAADDFAKLRHTAQKRYYEWWEACRDPDKVGAAKQAAEDMRVAIVEKLKREISEAEADYVNTPRMFEPFPANRNLVFCPESPLINEFGYRIQRLGEVIQRILPERRRAT